MELKFRKLEADEIECRPATVSKGKGVSLLLYKDARCDQNILDESVGALNWQKRYTRDNANCTVEIWDEDKKQWIGKEDTGTESNTEKEKGLASDSFKRACFAWGIGRALYTAPQIWIPWEDCELDKNGDYDKYQKFKVKEITYKEDDKVIDTVVIAKVKYGKETVVWPSRKGKRETKQEEPKEDKQVEILRRSIRTFCERHKVNVASLYRKMDIDENNMTEDVAYNLLRSLENKYGE